MKKFLVKLVNRLLHNMIHQLVRYFWVFANSESIFYFMEPFFTRRPWFLCSPCLLLITESISLDTFDKTGITWICLTIWEEIDDTSSFTALTTTSGCKIFHKMFFNNSINITFKWSINNFFVETIFFVPFPQTFFLGNLISLSLLGLESFDSFHLVS